MKIEIKSIFNNKNLDKVDNFESIENIDNIESRGRNEKIETGSSVKRRRKRPYEDLKDKEKKVDLKKYFDNFFKNKNKLPKGYYVLLLCMVALGTISVGVTCKAYNLFAKEDYELYAKSDDSKEEAISTMGQIQDVEEENKSNENATDADVAEAKLNTSNKSNNSTSSSSKKSKVSTSLTPLSFVRPIEGNIQKPYSIDKVVYSKTLELWKTHDGIDISAEIGKNVKSIEKGTVEKVYEDSFYGITVVIDHGQGYKSSYSNLDKNVSVKAKQVVTKGQVIGKISNTSIGEIKDESHLHFTLFKDNNNIDPTYIFK